MFIVKDAFIYSFMITAAAVLYLPFYIRTRRASFLKEDIRKNIALKVCFCLIFNLTAALTASFMNGKPAGKFFVCLLMLIADIDLLSGRIPTELLCVLGGFCLWKMVHLSNFIAVIPGALILVLWHMQNKKKIIGLYDVLMILFLTLCLSGLRKTLIFYALVMILWGTVGMLLHVLFHKQADTKIPLSPLIIAAFLITQQYL